MVKLSRKTLLPALESGPATVLGFGSRSRLSGAPVVEPVPDHLPPAPRPPAEHDVAWRFRILGPLTVERDGVELAVGPGKQRALLVSLLLDANHLVPLNRLVELLWEGEPPRSAVANIRTYASRLRVMVAGGGAERVVWRPPGYLFTAGEEEVDLLTYERLVEEGRKALARGDTAAAVSRFTAALGLWRGAAAEDVSRTHRLGSRLAGLDEQRVSLIEEWMDARLCLGDNREALGELRQLTGAHPLRERLWSQLMLASYRVGGTGPALQVFEEARRVLVDQLGTEPGPELAKLQTAVLRHDPSLLADTPPVDLAPVPRRPRWVPCELPPGVWLIGRERELAAIRAAAAVGDHPAGGDNGLAGSTGTEPRNGPVIVAIHGPGGIGKSALAVHVAHHLRQRYPDGQIYVDLHGSTTGLPAEDPLDVLRRFLRTLDADPEQMAMGSDEAAAHFRSLTADRKMIIVLDNAVDEAQVRQLLPSSPHALVLVTSRRMLAALDGPVHMELRPLSADAARVLLSRLAGGERAEAEPEELSRLAALCDYLPLALRVVGARLASQPDRPLSALSAQLSHQRGRLDALCYGDLAVRSSLAISYQRLVIGAELFRLLAGVHVADFCPAIASAILGRSKAATQQALDELVDARLLEQIRPGRYRMHDLVRLYAAELGSDRVGMEPALHRVLSRFVSTARRAVAVLHPGLQGDGTEEFVEAGECVSLDGPSQALAWLEAERVSMIEVARQVHDAEPSLARSVPLLAAALYPYLATHEYWDELGELGCLARTVAVRLDDRRAEATALACLAMVGRQRGRLAEAKEHLDRAIGICRTLRDHQALAALLSHLGMTCALAGDWEAALEHLRRSNDLHQMYGPRAGEGVARNDAAEVLCLLGRYGEADEMFAEALDIRRAVGDRLGEAITMTGIGKLACLRGAYDDAIAALSDALPHCAEFGARHYEWQALTWRAYAWFRLDRLDRAATDLGEALAMSRSRGNLRKEGLTARLLGVVWRRRGQAVRAAGYESRAAELFRDEHPQPAHDSIPFELWQ